MPFTVGQNSCYASQSWRKQLLCLSKLEKRAVMPLKVGEKQLLCLSKLEKIAVMPLKVGENSCYASQRWRK